jgi:hypothetical protein
MLRGTSYNVLRARQGSWRHFETVRRPDAECVDPVTVAKVVSRPKASVLV